MRIVENALDENPSDAQVTVRHGHSPVNKRQIVLESVSGEAITNNNQATAFLTKSRGAVTLLEANGADSWCRAKALIIAEWGGLTEALAAGDASARDGGGVCYTGGSRPLIY